jgi:hypothetical protein
MALTYFGDEFLRNNTPAYIFAFVGLGTTISPPPPTHTPTHLCWFFLLNGFLWHIKWPMIHGTTFCQLLLLFDNFLTTFWQLFWQLFDNLLQLFDNFFDTFLTILCKFLTTFWQLFDNFFLLCDTKWHFNTFVTPQVFQFIGPSNDGRRHGRGTYLFVYDRSIHWINGDR